MFCIFSIYDLIEENRELKCSLANEKRTSALESSNFENMCILPWFELVVQPGLKNFKARVNKVMYSIYMYIVLCSHTWSTLSVFCKHSITHAPVLALSATHPTQFAAHYVLQLQIFIKIFLSNARRCLSDCTQLSRNPSTFISAQITNHLSWNCILWCSMTPTDRAGQLVIQQVAYFGHATHICEQMPIYGAT